jgi:hypothetical protein
MEVQEVTWGLPHNCKKERGVNTKDPNLKQKPRKISRGSIGHRKGQVFQHDSWLGLTWHGAMDRLVA